MLEGKYTPEDLLAADRLLDGLERLKEQYDSSDYRVPSDAAKLRTDMLALVCDLLREVRLKEWDCL